MGEYELKISVKSPCFHLRVSPQIIFFFYVNWEPGNNIFLFLFYISLLNSGLHMAQWPFLCTGDGEGLSCHIRRGGSWVIYLTNFSRLILQSYKLVLLPTGIIQVLLSLRQNKAAILRPKPLLLQHSCWKKQQCNAKSLRSAISHNLKEKHKEISKSAGHDFSSF